MHGEKGPESYKEWVRNNPLRVWRKEKQLIEAAAGAMIGASEGSVRNWELGAVRPSKPKMSQIAQMMQLSQRDLEQRWNEWMTRRPTSV